MDLTVYVYMEWGSVSVCEVAAVPCRVTALVLGSVRDRQLMHSCADTRTKRVEESRI